MKKITIEKDENGMKFICEGFDSFEAMGVLRYYEKKLWMDVSLSDKESMIEDRKENTN